jgi:glycosyltransferase involved in cell wall biosynthesis
MVKPLRIALVSAYPPSRRPLSEYAWHVVQSLRTNPRVQHVHVLADRCPNASEQNDRVTVHRCWSFSSIDQPATVALAARRLNVDVVWFNLHLTSGGNTRSSWFAGLAAPAATRSAGVVTVVTLHNMLGCTDVKWAGPKTYRADRVGAHIATSQLAAANVVCVLVPEYATLLRSRYGFRCIHVMPLGTLGTPAGSPVRETGDTRTLVSFGHFGSYKRLEDLLEVMADISVSRPDIRLKIAGTDSRHTPGYLARLKELYRHVRNVTFEGYVSETDVPGFFRASASVLPYATTAGTSAVAMQSAMYGVPIIASDVPGFRSLERSGMRMTFFEWGSKDSLKDAISRVLFDRTKRLDDASHNLAYCRSQPMDTVIDRYLDIFEAALAANPRCPVASPAVAVDAPVGTGSR